MTTSFESLVVVLYFWFANYHAFLHNHKAKKMPLLSHYFHASFESGFIRLSAYRLRIAVFRLALAPGAVNTVSHRDDYELFGYVLEGQVQITLITKEPRLFRPPNVLRETKHFTYGYPKSESRKNDQDFTNLYH